MLNSKEDSDARREAIIKLAQDMADVIPDDADVDDIACATSVILNRAYLPYRLSVRLIRIPIISDADAE